MPGFARWRRALKAAERTRGVAPGALAGAVYAEAEKRTALLQELKEVFRRHQSRPVEALIAEINPKLRGWVNYFRIGHARRAAGGVGWAAQAGERPGVADGPVGVASSPCPRHSAPVSWSSRTTTRCSRCGARCSIPPAVTCRAPRPPLRPGSFSPGSATLDPLRASTYARSTVDAAVD
jgi:hypothetical protein